MKKNYKNVFCILIILFILIVINILLNEKDILCTVFSFSIFLIFVNSFSHIDIEKKVIELKNKGNVNDLKKIFYFTIGIIIIINIIYILFICIMNLFFGNDYYLYNFNYVLITMGITIFIIPTLNVLCQYLRANNLKKLGYVIKRFFYFIWFFLFILLLIVNYKINIPSYVFAIFIYLLELLSFMITIFCCLLFIKDRRIFLLKSVKVKEKNDVSVKKILKIIFTNNIKLSLKRIIYISYYYIAIIFIYYILLYKFGYGYKEIAFIVKDTYVINFLLILLLVLFYILNHKLYIYKIINKIKLNECNGMDIESLFIDVLKSVLPITILICILSGPILKLIFNISNSVIFMFFIWLFPFIVLYIIGIKILESLNNNKILYITLCSGILIKIFLIIPLVNCMYRMGYNIIYGEILSSIIGLFVSCIIAIIYLNKKYKVNFAMSFEKILNIVYQNIILSVILIVSSVIIPLNVSTKFESLIVILLYSIIFVIYIFIKKIFILRGVKK